MGREDQTLSHGVGEETPRLGRAHLLVIDGSTSSRIDLPESGMLTVGRATDGDVVLHDRSVSRKHAQIQVEHGQVRVIDLGSHNGVRVNGEPVVKARVLTSGDVVSLGEVTLVLYTAPPESKPAPYLGAVLLRQRLEEEVARAVEYERPLVLVWVSLGAAVSPTVVAQALASRLRRIDVVGWQDEQQLVVLSPELGPQAASRLLEELQAALRPLAPSVKLGQATCGTDGCDARTLLSAAASAAAGAAPGGTAEAGQQVTELRLGERVVLVADPAMVRIYELIRRLAASELPVLVTGETGAGKENAAFAVHFWSRRSAGPFVAINCAAIAETLVESELFGHEKGAFTGASAAKAGLLESAAGGTVFLDEAGELSAAVQAKLLRALETRSILRVGGVKEVKIDVRIVAATHRRLEEEVAAGRFRKDLYFRLSAATVVLPPLRERAREVGLLSQRFLDDACTTAGRSRMTLAPAALAVLARYDWPGNVRELKNAMDYVACVAAAQPEEVVEPWHLPERITATRAATAAIPLAAPEVEAEPPEPSPEPPKRGRRPLVEELRTLERERMVEALKTSGGVKVRAAELLRMPIRTFTFKCKQYGL